MRICFRPNGRWSTWGLFACAAALLMGCGEKQTPQIPLVSVHGKILVEDQPVKSGTVSFRPDGELGNKTMEQPGGMIQEDGSFELFTIDRAGAPTGWYRVLVIADNMINVDPPKSPVWPDYPEGFLPKALVHDRYLSFKKTDIKVEVKENSQPEDYVIRLNP
ncbi:MAG: hypothetical protein ABGX16_03245 [Pirellulales bacterium]